MKQPGKAGPRPCERDSMTGAPAAERRAPSSPWPPSARGHVLSFKQTDKEARASKYSPHGRTGAGLALRRVWRVRGIVWSRQKEKPPNHPLAESPDSTKASGATVGYHN